MKRIILVLVMLNALNLFSQSLSVFDIDTTAFPIIKAKFYAFDAAGKQILNLSPSDFTISENRIPRTVLSVSCPAPKPEVPISSLLLLDISGSMCLNPLQIVKDAAIVWTDLMKANSDCAVCSFSDNSYINQDFTKNKNKVLSAINSINCMNGTNFDNAFLEFPYGAIPIASTGKNKKIIILMSDGGANFPPNEAEIIKQAKLYGISIFALTIGFDTPDHTKHFTEQTGGMWFDDINTKQDAENAFRKILAMAQNNEPCSIEWQTNVNCFFGKNNVEISLNSSKINISYFPPVNSYIQLTFSPAGISFKNKPIGKKADTTVTVKAINSDFSISNITSTSDYFDINPKSFSLKKGESKLLTVSFTPVDSNRYFTTFEIVNDKCPFKAFASGFYTNYKSTLKTLKLIEPNGAEKFLAGTDTVITWEGVLPSDTVKLEYSIDNGRTWNLITDSAKSLNYFWKNIPKSPSNECLARVSTIGANEFKHSIEWQKCLGGSSDELVYSIIQTTDGGYIAAGSSSSNDGDVSGNHGDVDYWIVKLNSIADIEWQKSLGGSSVDEVHSIIQTTDGGYIVAGSNSSNDGDVSGNHGGWDYWIVKLNKIGDIEWQKSLGGSAGDYAYSIQQTIDGGYIVAGSSNSKDADVSGNHGGWDYWVVKLNSVATIEWQKSYGGSGDDNATSIQQTYDGGYIVAGTSFSKDADVSGNQGRLDYWVVKLNSVGTIEWQKSYGGSDDDYATSIQQTYDGGYIIAGYAYSNDGDVSGNHGGLDYWVVKLNSVGTIEWQKSYGGSADDNAFSIQQAYDGGYIVAGTSFSKDGDAKGNEGYIDYWVLKLNSIGVIEWQKFMGGSFVENALSIKQTNDGGYIIAGYAYSNDGDVSGNHGGLDYWIVKLSPDAVTSQSDISDSLWAIVVPEASATDIDLGKTLVNVEKDSTIHGFVKNVGSYPVHVNKISFAGADASMFAVGAGKPPFDVPVGKSVPVEFCFKPSSAGIKTAQILIETLDSTLTQIIRGEGVEPTLSISAKLVNFGVLELNSRKDTTLVLVKNIGSSQINVTDTKLLGPDKTQFEILSGGGAFTLQPDSSRELTLSFKPKYIGRTTGEIGFVYSGTGSPARALLYGQGIGGTIVCTDDSAFVGEKRDIKLLLTGVKANSVQSVASQFRAKLRFQKTVIAPTDNSLVSQFQNDSTIVEIQSTIENSDILKTIQFVAGLGTAEQTYIEIIDFKWLDDSGNEVDYETETQDGLFRILGICEEGGKRLINPDNKNLLMMVRPNPAGEEAEIEFQLAEKENSKIYITNLLGENIKTVFEGSNCNYELQRTKIDLSQIPADTYFLILQTPTDRKTVRFVVNR